jgi:BNR/Asp-box repeat
MLAIRLVFTLIIGWFFQSPVGDQPVSKEGCRNIIDEIRYTVPYAHAESGSKDATVREWTATGTKSALLRVYAPAPEKPHWFSVKETFTTSDFGNNWNAEVYDVPSPLMETEAGYRASSNPKVVYRRLNESGLYLRSEDGGETWTLPRHLIEGVTSEVFAARQGGSRFYHTVFSLLAVHPHQPLTIYAALEVDPWALHTYALPKHEQNQVYVSDDGGENWKALTAALQARPGWGGIWLPPIGISPVNPSILFGQSFHGLVKSVDAGKTWSAVGHQEELHKRPLYVSEQPEKLKAAGLPPDYQIPGYPIAMEVSQFLFHPTNPDVVYVVSNKGVHRTLDGGNTWVMFGLSLNEVGAIHSAALNPLDPNMIIVGTKYGLFLSSDGGCHFREVRSPRDPGPEKADGGREIALPSPPGEETDESSIF